MSDTPTPTRANPILINVQIDAPQSPAADYVAPQVTSDVASRIPECLCACGTKGGSGTGGARMK
jgi:hypothetical protein